MRVTGSRVIRAPAADIWGFLLTPERLRTCLPGCERFEATGPDRYDARLVLGVGFLKGSYSGVVRVTESQPHDTLGLAVQGSGLLGSMHAGGILHFTEAGGVTVVRYDGDAGIGGRIAGLGERVVSATASRLINRFFDCVASKVEHE